MVPSTPPQAVAVEVVAARPTDADEALIARLGQETGRDMEQVAYLVKVRLQSVPPAASAGWGLYVGDFRVPKYWQYVDGLTLAAPEGLPPSADVGDLPRQSDVLG